MERELFAVRLRDAMNARGCKQVDLVRAAENAGVKLGKSHVSQYVAGKTVPRADVLRFLALTLEVDEDWLLSLIHIYAEYFDNMLQRGLDEGAEQGITPEFIEGIRKDYDEYYAAGNTTLFDSEEFCALEYQFTNGGTFDKWVNFIYTVPAMNEWLTELGIQWFPLTNIAGFPWPRWSGQELSLIHI